MNAKPQVNHAIETPRAFSARTEPFDSYWQGTRDLEKGFRSFNQYYKVNYLPRMPADRDARILILSCGPGYLVNCLVGAGYRNVLGIDADPEKIKHALSRSLPCEVSSVFSYLEGRVEEFDMIVPEQELNHLTIDEVVEFLQLCRKALKPSGQLLVYAINGTNPIVAPEHISHNIDHFFNVTEYSLAQLLHLGGFREIRPFACKLYVFWTSPLNYVGLAITASMELVMRLIFRLYDERASIMSKRIAATAVK